MPSHYCHPAVQRLRKLAHNAGNPDLDTTLPDQLREIADDLERSLGTWSGSDESASDS